MRWFLILSLAILAGGVSSHPETDVQIAALTQDLETNPCNAQLYLRRADVYAQHEDWSAALADCDSAEDAEPRNPYVRFQRAHVLLLAGHPGEALPQVQMFLLDEPASGDGRLLAARIHEALEDFPAASAAYERAFEEIPTPQPDDFLSYVSILRRTHPTQVLEKLDAIINERCASPALIRLAVEVEMEQALYDAALARVDKFFGTSPRRENYLILRAGILNHAGRTDEAFSALSAAAQEIDKRAPQKNSAASEELKESIRRQLLVLSGAEREAEF